MASIVILLGLIAITNYLFGDYIIARFNLEVKYPWLSRIFKYRSIIKGYSIVFNLFIIYFMVIAVIIFNLFVFIV